MLLLLSVLSPGAVDPLPCGSRPVWMVGPFTSLGWNTSTPPTVANDARNGTLDVGGGELKYPSYPGEQ